MRNVEREENIFSSYTETGDKEGTYEQKKGGDVGTKTVFNGTSSSSNIFVQKKLKKKQVEKVVFSD